MGVFRAALGATLLWRAFRRWERGPEPKKSAFGRGAAHDAELAAAAAVLPEAEGYGMATWVMWAHIGEDEILPIGLGDEPETAAADARERVGSLPTDAHLVTNDDQDGVDGIKHTLNCVDRILAMRKQAGL